MDVLMVVRGFANEEHRLEETVKAIKHIAEWRDKVINCDSYTAENKMKINYCSGGILRILWKKFRRRCTVSCSLARVYLWCRPFRPFPTGATSQQLFLGICWLNKQGIRVEEIDTDGLLKLDEDQLLCLQVIFVLCFTCTSVQKIRLIPNKQGQKMKSYAVYKQDLSNKSGVQRLVKS